MFYYDSMVAALRTAVQDTSKVSITDAEFIENEIRRFKSSVALSDMRDGVRYYEGSHDILTAKREAIGQDGEPVEIENLPNNRIVDNQYRKMVDQKANYLVGNPVTLQSDVTSYADALNNMLDKRFYRTLKAVSVDAMNCGIGWMFAHYDADGNVAFTRIDPRELVAGWADDERLALSYAIRIYTVAQYDKSSVNYVERVEVYDESGITYFQLDGARLVPVEPYKAAYIAGRDGGYNWSKIPIVPFRYHRDERTLLRSVRSLQDGLNSILSAFQNNMQEDARNTILVLVNYDGEDLGHFRENLATYGAVKVRSIDGGNGDLKSLQVEVNAENYKTLIDVFKKAIIENAMGYDAKDDRMSGSPNQMNILSMYSDIDLDANGTETEYQAAFEQLLWFCDVAIANSGGGSYENTAVDVVFNRNILMNEGEVIENIAKSTGILSTETLLLHHPWVDDVQKEIARKESEQPDDYGGAFTMMTQADEDVNDDGDAGTAILE